MLTHFTHRALILLNDEVFQKSTIIQKLSIFQCEFTCETFEIKYGIYFKSPETGQFSNRDSVGVNKSLTKSTVMILTISHW